MSVENLEMRATDLKISSLEKDNARLREESTQYNALKLMYSAKEDEVKRLHDIIFSSFNYPNWFIQLGNFLFNKR